MFKQCREAVSVSAYLGLLTVSSLFVFCGSCKDIMTYALNVTFSSSLINLNSFLSDRQTGGGGGDRSKGGPNVYICLREYDLQINDSTAFFSLPLTG